MSPFPAEPPAAAWDAVVAPDNLAALDQAALALMLYILSSFYCEFLDSEHISSAFLLLHSQLPSILDSNAQGFDLRMWGRILSNMSHAVQVVGVEQA